jgi:putative phosphoesterase
MLLGIVSDTHSRYQTVAEVLGLLAERGVRQILHCGDIEDDETVKLFQGIETHFVFGNCDSDRKGLSRAIKKTGAVLHENFGHLETQGIRIAWTHGDNGRLCRELEASGSYDFLFYGHTHRAESHRSGRTWVINPGALYRANPKSFVILDPAAKCWESIELRPENR